MNAVCGLAGSGLGTWIPHFTSVINWTLRLGLGLLKQVAPIATPWFAIIDHSIDIGTKKALVVLRVPADALSRRKSAIRLEDCECIGLKVCEQVNGESIAADLAGIFKLAGSPAAILTDGDSTLQKGVRLWTEAQPGTISIIRDVGHAIATALRHQYEKDPVFQRFITLVNQAANRFRQTDLAFLIPPKLRSKGRFQSISKLGNWAEKILAVISVKGRAKKGSVLARLRRALPKLLLLKSFIRSFIGTTQVVEDIMGILKNRGLTQDTYAQCKQLVATLPKQSVVVKQKIEQWLQQHLDIHKKFPDAPLLVSTDLIESLFGKFKHIINRSPQADMNRSVLLIPALCGKLDGETICSALKLASHQALDEWEKENIPYTVRRKRREFFDGNTSQNRGSA